MILIVVIGFSGCSGSSNEMVDANIFIVTSFQPVEMMDLVSITFKKFNSQDLIPSHSPSH